MPTALPSLQGYTGKQETHDFVHCTERFHHRRKHWYAVLVDSPCLWRGFFCSGASILFSSC